ncbi:MAG: thioredoxin domain-containing protein [Candidatus Omnitrophica bacterium]|nr:thioredoxin domain-containing protein [Candidatus Omnitrophota bacterium]
MVESDTTSKSNAHGQNRKPNRLINEKSPYLLQHAYNPVNWYPWGSEAFEKAKKEDKPIFLSIGYSTCHWCHVMERESFSDPKVAAIMNEHFVSIKVDREERPDVDTIYMAAVMTMTGSGGWPLTAFVTPDLKPFYGGTYFPPEDKWGRPGLKTLLRGIADAWKNRRGEVLRSSESLTQLIQAQSHTEAGKGVSLSEETLKKGFQQYASQFDSDDGGFGSAPKFPRSHSLSFLLRYWKKSQDPKALEMVEKTLQEMAKGGMYDHIGGGFHRYSTDPQWRVPHFEKMLYDQTILAKTYLEAYQVTKKDEYARIAREIFDYVLRDMTGPEGGFYSAEDADSAPDPKHPDEKSEGAFYLWTKSEVSKILGKEEAETFSYRYGVQPNGNTPFDPHGEFTGKNILYEAHSLEETAEKFGKSVEEAGLTLLDAKMKLFATRSKRLRPHLDDKILADWNGLMISSLAFGSRVLNEPKYRQAAEKAADFILSTLVTKEGRLLHRYRKGEAALAGTIEDYAFFIHGLFDLYEATFDSRYLEWAKRLAATMVQLFWDEKNGGFFFTADDAEKLLFRPRELYDGAIPSGNSVAALDLIRVGRLTMEKEFEGKAEVLMKTFSGEISNTPMAYPQLLIALDFALGPSKEIVIAGTPDDPATGAMVREVFGRFLPNKVVALRLPGEEGERLSTLVPFAKLQVPLGGKATAYVCENYVCNLPTTDLEKMITLLEEK